MKTNGTKVYDHIATEKNLLILQQTQQRMTKVVEIMEALSEAVRAASQDSPRIRLIAGNTQSIDRGR